MYARVAAFEDRDMSLADDLIAKVRDDVRREDSIPGAHGFLMLVDREHGTALGITLFATEQELRAAEPAFEQMASTIPAEMRGRRVSVEVYEVLGPVAHLVSSDETPVTPPSITCSRPSTTPST